MGNEESRPERLSAEDKEYLRSQAGAVGSGALGGWSQSAFGGYLDDGPRGVLEAVRAELRQIQSRAFSTPLAPAEHRVDVAA